MASASTSKSTLYKRSRGSELLAEWRGKLNKAEVVTILDIDYSAISAFETGYRVPGRERADRIAEKTRGAVPAESWSQPPRRKKRAS